MFTLTRTLFPIVLFTLFTVGTTAHADTLALVSDPQTFGRLDIQQASLSIEPISTHSLAMNEENAGNVFTDIPEPSSIALGAIGGLLAIAALRRKRRENRREIVQLDDQS